MLNFNPCFTIHTHWPLHPSATLKTKAKVSPCQLSPGTAGLVSSPLTQWPKADGLVQGKSCMRWTGRAAQIYTLLFETQTTGDDSSLFSPWQEIQPLGPVKVIWIYLTKRKMKKREKERRGKNFLSSDWRYAQDSDFLCTFDHAVDSLGLLHRGFKPWSKPMAGSFDSQIMTSTLQASARHSPTPPACSDCCASTKRRVRG